MSTQTIPESIDNSADIIDVRVGHKRVLWTESVDGFAADSYDAAAEKILEREASE